MASSRLKRAMVDLDGCVANTYEDAMIRELKAQYGLDIPFSELTNVNFTAHPLITADMLIHIFSQKKFYDSLEVYDGAIEGLRALRDNGIEVVICTVRPNNDDVRNDTLHWFTTHNIPFDSIHIIPRQKTHVGNGKAKARIVQAAKCDFFFEDDPINILPLSKVCKKGFMVNQPYNIGMDIAPNVVSVSSIAEAAEMIKNGRRS